MHSARPFNSWDAFKLLALLLMFVDHLGAFFLIHEQWLRSIGRGSAPIFLFLAGYASSYRFSWELLILASLMVLSNMLMGEYIEPLNIIFNILMCRAVFAWMEKRGKVIERPLEWFIALSVFILVSSFLVQYGTLGLLFAISGYMKRRPEHYSVRVQRWFLVATFMAYAATFAFFFDLTLASFFIMVPVLLLDGWLMLNLKIRPLNMSGVPAWLTRFLTLSSHYSGYIYAIHLIIISWITHYPI